MWRCDWLSVRYKSLVGRVVWAGCGATASMRYSVKALVKLETQVEIRATPAKQLRLGMNRIAIVSATWFSELGFVLTGRAGAVQLVSTILQEDGTHRF